MITSSPDFMSEKSTMSVRIVGLHRIEKFFPSVNLTLKNRYPSSYPCEIQSTFFPRTSGYRLRSFSCFFLIRLSRRLCSAALIGVIGVLPTHTTLRFLLTVVPPAGAHGDQAEAANHLLCGGSGLLRLFWALSSCACPGGETGPTAVSLPVCARARRRASIDRFHRWSGARRRARRCILPRSGTHRVLPACAFRA